MPALLALVPLKDWLYGAALLALVTAGVVGYHHVVDIGWDRALDAVKKQDGRAIDAASTVQKTVDQCYASGGVWSTISGECAQ